MPEPGVRGPDVTERGVPLLLFVAAVIAAAAIGGAVAHDVLHGPDAWARIGRLDGCDVYENRFTGRLRLECPPEGGRHA